MTSDLDNQSGVGDIKVACTSGPFFEKIMKPYFFTNKLLSD